MKKKKSLPADRQGFTLLEILVSAGILAIVSTFMVQVLFTTTHVNKKTEIIEDVKQNGSFTLDVISRMVRSAKTIETTCAEGELTASSALIRNYDNNQTTLTCLSDGNVARIASVSGTGTVAYLSGGTVTVSESGGAGCGDSSLTFSCPPVGGGVQNQLTVIFTLGPLGASASDFESGTSTFHSTILMRN